MYELKSIYSIMGIFLAFRPLFIFLLLVSPPLAQSSRDAPLPPPHTHTRALNHITPSPHFPQTGSVITQTGSFLIHSHSQNI